MTPAEAVGSPSSHRWWSPGRGDIDVIIAQVGFNLAQMVIPVFLLVPGGHSDCIQRDSPVARLCTWDSWLARWAWCGWR